MPTKSKRITLKDLRHGKTVWQVKASYFGNGYPSVEGISRLQIHSVPKIYRTFFKLNGSEDLEKKCSLIATAVGSPLSSMTWRETKFPYCDVDTGFFVSAQYIDLTKLFEARKDQKAAKYWDEFFTTREAAIQYAKDFEKRPEDEKSAKEKLMTTMRDEIHGRQDSISELTKSVRFLLPNLNNISFPKTPSAAMPSSFNAY